MFRDKLHSIYLRPSADKMMNNTTSSQQRPNHFPMHIGQASVQAVVSEGQLFVVDSQEIQHGGMDVVNRRRMIAIGGFEAPFVTFPISCASFDTTAA